MKDDKRTNAGAPGARDPFADLVRAVEGTPRNRTVGSEPSYGGFEAIEVPQASWEQFSYVPAPASSGSPRIEPVGQAAPPRAAFPWAPPLLALQERLAEEGKRKDRRNSCGLLREIHALEKCAQRLAEAIRGGYFGLFTRPSLTSQAVKDLFKGANVQCTKTQIQDVLQTKSRSSVCSAQIIVLRVCHRQISLLCK